MGIILQEPYTTSQGIVLANLYASFATNTIVTEAVASANVKTFNIYCPANLYVDRECREAGKKYLDTLAVTARGVPSADAPYTSLYAELKNALPASIDD